MGESHKIVTLATKDSGIISAIARHGGKSKKRFPASLDYFKIIEIQAERKSSAQEMWQLQKAGVVNFYSRIPTNLNSYLAGCWAIDCSKRFVPPEIPDLPIFDWLKDNFDFLDKNPPEPLYILFSFLKLVFVTGHNIIFDRCVKCGKVAPHDKPAYFDASSGGIVCRSCGKSKIIIPADLKFAILAVSSRENLQSMEDLQPQIIDTAHKNRNLILKILYESFVNLYGHETFSLNLLVKYLGRE